MFLVPGIFLIIHAQALLTLGSRGARTGILAMEAATTARFCTADVIAALEGGIAGLR